jgi:hypothetical protein
VRVIRGGKNVAAYQVFEQQLIDDLKPDGSCQVEVIGRLAATLWRLRRIPRFEAALMALLSFRRRTFQKLKEVCRRIFLQQWRKRQ